MLLEHPVLPFVVAAVIAALAPRRVGVAAMVIAPVVALVQFRAIDPDLDRTWQMFGFELTPLRVDDLSTPFVYVFCMAAALAAVFGATTFSRGERVAAVASAGFGVGVVLAGDLMTLFVMWEMKAVVSAVLIALGGSAVSNGAAYRYLIVHVLGGSLLLGGIVWHLSGGGSLAFDSFGTDSAGTLILLAFLLSAAMPPLHAWLPDAYPAASVAGTVFLSAFTTKAAVYALLRGFAGLEILVYLGVAMAIYGVVYAVLENDLRRLLSYHIVSQVGFMVAAVGIGTAAAVNGATAHAFAHILYKGLLLMGVGALITATGRSKLTELGGVWRQTPWILGLYMVAAFSISGVPLFSGFVSKELVIDAAYGDGRDMVVYLLKFASVGTFLSTALKLPWFAWFGPDRGLTVRSIPSVMYVAMAITAAANVVIGLAPGLLYDVMPNPVDYEPFSLAKLSETLQLLGFTGLAFWILVDRLKGDATITLDTDWLYRVAPQRAMATAGPRWAPARESLAARASAATWPVRARVSSAMGRSGETPAVTPTIALGVVTIGTFTFVLALALIT
ncbi:MAG: Na(+)/H(+) antiporter subunit D [Acidimicrobiales bacterium]